MRYLVFICLSLCIITITGCSSKVEPVKKETVFIKKQSTLELEETDFLDEFENELKVDVKSDPLSGYNRIMTNFNDKMFTYVLSPVSTGYRTVVHEKIRSSVDNFFHNILYPIRLVNNLLQGKFVNSVDETSRFLINSTFGVFGLFDPAKRNFGLKAHNEDFGQTLGFYGVAAGPHIVLPFFGPSNLRDTFSMYPDSFINPITYTDDTGYNLTNSDKESLLLKGYERINFISQHESEYEKMKKDAVDLYPFLRDIYEQDREQQIKE